MLIFTNPKIRKETCKKECWYANLNLNARTEKKKTATVMRTASREIISASWGPNLETP